MVKVFEFFGISHLIIFCKTHYSSFAKIYNTSLFTIFKVAPNNNKNIVVVGVDQRSHKFILLLNNLPPHSQFTAANFSLIIRTITSEINSHNFTHCFNLDTTRLHGAASKRTANSRTVLLLAECGRKTHNRLEKMDRIV